MMNNCPECIPCCLRRVLRTASSVTTDEWLHRKILAEVMQDLAKLDEIASPAEVLHGCVRTTAKTLGVADPYAEEKARWIEETTANADLIQGFLDAAQDRFDAAVRLSLVAGIFDWELREESSPGYSLKRLLEEAGKLSLPADSVEDLRSAAGEAARILFVHASAAELLFDRLLISEMKKSRGAVVSVVREAPILAHATRKEAAAAGLEEVARIVDPGVACLGLPLMECSQAFREEYADADLVIAKGQAAYETLEGKSSQIDGEAKDVFFLLRVKCAFMAGHLGVEVGDCVLERS